MHLEGDPGTNPLGRPRYLQNVRFEGGNLKGRDPILEINSTALQSSTAHVKDLYDFQTNKPRRLYVAYIGCPGVSTSVGLTLAWIDFDLSPPFQRGIYYLGAVDARLAVGSFDGKVLLGTDADLRALHVIVQSYGTESLASSGTEQSPPLVSFTGFLIGVISRDFDGRVFIAMDNAGPGTSKVMSWDGLTAREDLTGLGLIPSSFCVWRDQLVMGFNDVLAIGNQLRVRSRGDSTGGTAPSVWSTVLATGLSNAVNMVSYKDILYITDSAANVWRYDGTGVPTIVRTIAGAQLTGLAVHGGYLYFGYESSTARAIIGRFDGTTWTDSYKDMTTQDATLRNPTQIASYRGCLVLFIRTSTVATKAFLSSDSDTLTYTQLNPNNSVGLNANEIVNVVVL